MANGSLTNYGAALYLNHIWGTTTKTTHTPHMGLFLSNATVSGPGSEPTSGNYQRLALTPTDFTPASAGSIQTALDLEFNRASGEWGRIVGCGIFDSSVGGNCIAFADFAGDELVKINNQLVLLSGGFIHRFISGTWSEYLQHLILDDLYRQIPLVTFPTIYAAGYTTAATELAPGTEPVGNGYARVAVANNTSNFTAAAGNSKNNSTDIQFPNATGSWGNLVSFGFHTASTGGTYLAGGTLSSTGITTGDVMIYGAGMLTFTLR